MFTSFQDRITFLSHGGPVMILLIISSLICLSFIIERWFSLRREKILPSGFLKEVQHLAAQKKTAEIISLSRSHNNPVARILIKDNPFKAYLSEILNLFSQISPSASP